ncbi:hypothetical protein [Mumia sp. Pv 4-285]|uniref:hypothetical protein n=1 Tax=Mumia qirimensis TaxID=3234852 RepID=UPI00351D78C8
MTETTSSPDPLMQRVTDAVALGRSDRAAARDALAATWFEVGDDGDPFYRCVIAHYLADVTADPEDELLWDQRALDAAHETTDARAQQYDASLAIAGFFPSLHLNLADVLRRLGRFDEAAVHAEHAAARVDILPDDGYASTIREALAGVRYAIAARDTGPRESSPSS